MNFPTVWLIELPIVLPIAPGGITSAYWIAYWIGYWYCLLAPIGPGVERPIGPAAGVDAPYWPGVCHS